MTDGAHLGLTAESAMRAVIGGEQPEEEPMSAQQMAAWINATTPADATTYDGTARYAAKLVLDWLLADPTRANSPTEDVYQHGPDGKTDWSNPTVVQPGWYERMKDDGIPLDQLDLTGFMWGWAVNAARRCVELPSVPNPAIIEIDL